MSEMVSMEEYENIQRQEDTTAVSAENETKKKEPFAFWQVDGESYRLKLRTAEQLELEKIYKRNLFSLIGDADNLPPLSTMLQIAHAAMKPYRHGIKLKDVENLYSRYVDQGGSMLQFYVDVYMRIYAVSGFFSSSMEEDLSQSMEKISSEMR